MLPLAAGAGTARLVIVRVQVIIIIEPLAVLVTIYHVHVPLTHRWWRGVMRRRDAGTRPLALAQVVILPNQSLLARVVLPLVILSTVYHWTTFSYNKQNTIHH